MVVQHNLQALNANRMLGITTKTVAGSTEKLSSGYKINRAADDAAGLSISEKMRKQVRGLTRAATNAEDGISCVQTAEGALAEVQDMLQRMNELCVQAANGTMSEADRKYIQDEIDQMVTEIDRVAETTKFNETFLLKGDTQSPTKTSYITNYTTTYKKNDMVWTDKSQSPCTYCMNYTGNNNIYVAESKIKDTGANIALGAAKISKGMDMTKYLVKATADTASINKGKATLNTASYTAFINVELDSDVKSGADLYVDNTSSVVKARQDLYVYNTSNGTITHIKKDNPMTDYITDDNTMDEKYRLVDIIDSSAGTSERVKKQMLGGEDAGDFVWTDAYLEIAESAKQLYDADGNEVSGMALYKYFDDNGNYIGGLFSTAQARAEDEVFLSATSTVYKNIAQNLDSPPATIGKYITQASTDVAGELKFSLHVGAQSDKKNKISAYINTLTAAGIGIDKLASWNIGIVDATGANATDAIDVVGDALQIISEQRSILGAVQNRLEHTVKNLDNVVENTTAAESTIRDTDMAEMMVQYANANILQQAGQSMLAQANQSNQGVLSLLQQ